MAANLPEMSSRRSYNCAADTTGDVRGPKENGGQLIFIKDPFSSSEIDCDASPSLFDGGVREETFTVVLIGSMPSSIFLAALLLWACLLTAERHSEPNT